MKLSVHIAALCTLCVVSCSEPATRAPRLDASPQQPYSNVNPELYDARDLYLRNLVVTGSLVAPTIIAAGTPLDIPNTLVLRDDTGSFVATTVTVTGAVNFLAANNNTVTLAPNPATSPSYTFQLPQDSGTHSYVLTTDGTGATYWYPISAVGGTGISMLNGLVTSTQYFANGYAGTYPLFNSAINTHTLNIPLASSYAVLAGLISSTDYYNFKNTYTTINAGTPLDVPNTLVLRDNTGSFAATTITVTGAVIFKTATNAVTMIPASGTAAYTFQLPANGGASGYYLVTNGAGVTTWSAINVPAQGITDLNNLTTTTQFFANGYAGIQPAFNSLNNTHTLNIPLASTYGVLAGLISSTDYYNFSKTYTTVATGTPLDIPNTLVLRDNTGSFAATNVSLQAANTNQVTLAPQVGTSSYTFQLPATGGTSGYVLETDGTGITNWVAVSAAAASGITQLNGLTTSTQYFANGYAGTYPLFNSAINTHTLNIPLASSYAVLAGLISSTDYYNFKNTYTTLQAATPLDIPNTLVLRDNTGSFAATNVSLQAANANQVTLEPQVGTSSYTFQLPANGGTNGYYLVTNGAGVTTWSAVNIQAQGITDLNNLTTTTQFFANGYAGIQPIFNSLNNTHTLNIPLASSYAVLAGLISSTDYYNFKNTYTTLQAATPLDIPNTLVLRDNTGSFAATTVTVTGAVIFQTATNAVTMIPASGTSAYTFQLPANGGASGYYLSTNGSGVTTWSAINIPAQGITDLNNLTTTTQFFANGYAGIQPIFNSLNNTHTLNIPLASSYGVLAGLISSTDYYNFKNTYTTINAGTPLDIPNTLVLRDNTGSFAATTITVTGAVIFQTATNAVTMIPASGTSAYTFQLPTTGGTNGYYLVTNGAGVTTWSAVNIQAQGITDLNNLTTTTQFFANGYAGIQPIFNSLNNTHTLNIPLASSYGVLAGLISSTDYYNFKNTYTTLQAGTPLDIPNTLVLRDNTGSFAATNVTTTGAVIFKTATNAVTMIPASGTSAYTFQLPATGGTNNYVLSTNGSGVTNWVAVSAAGASGITELNNLTTTTQYFANGYAGIEPKFNSAINTHTLNIPLASSYGVLAGLISSTDYYNFRNTYTTVLAGTPLNIPNTLVKRDGTGSFAAQNITAATIETCSLVASCTYLLIEVAGTGTPYQLVLQPDTSIQPSMQLATRSPSLPDVSLELVLQGSGALYIWNNTNDETFLLPILTGTTRGAYAVDLQTVRTNPLFVASGVASSLVGGLNNLAAGEGSSVLGGSAHQAYGVASSIVGGQVNTVDVNGAQGGILAGYLNYVNGEFAVVLGGSNNQATGTNAVAAGHLAQALDNNSFVWADHSGYTSQGVNTFNVHAAGGVFMPDSILGGSGSSMVYDTVTGQLGYTVSSQRYKYNIKPLDATYSDKVLQLEPVSFNYKKTPEVDSIGLIAEAVQEILPELVVKNKDGEIETIKYHELPVLLLAALKKEHELVQELRGEVTSLQEQIRMLLNFTNHVL